MVDAAFKNIFDMWPVPAILADDNKGNVLAVNEMAAQQGFGSGIPLKEMLIQKESVDEWLTIGDKPVSINAQIWLGGRERQTTASLRRLHLAEQEVILIVFTAIKAPGSQEDNAAVAALCEIYASGQKNALRTFLQASAITLGAFSAAVYEKRKERYIIREEWRSRRAVSISILSADFEVHPEQEMARIGQLKHAEGLGYAQFIKSYGTHGVLIYFFDQQVEQELYPRIERFARLLRVLSPDTPRHGSAAVLKQGLDSLQQGIAVWDKHTKRLIYENKAYHELFGSRVPFQEDRRSIGPTEHTDARGRQYSLSHIGSRLGSQRLVTTHVSDVTRYKLAEEKLAMTAKTDPLTGLYNRRAGLEILEEIYDQCRSMGRALTVGFADIDGLKAINDTYGHGAGDAMIRSVADVIKKNIGKEGTVCRLGGDEFVLILPGTNQVQALLLANQIKNGVSRCFVGGSRSISISFGFKQAEYSREETAASLVSVADSDMYRDKRDSRTID